MSLQAEQHPRATPHQGRVEFGRSSRASSRCYLFPEIEIPRYKVLREPEIHTHKRMFHTSTHLAREEAKKLEIKRAKDKKITKHAPHKPKPKTLAPMFAQVLHTVLARSRFFGNCDTHNCERGSWHQLSTTLIPFYSSATQTEGKIQRPKQLTDPRATIRKVPSASKVDGARRAQDSR